MQDTKIPLLLFAKAPIAGKVKTRLQTHCSARQAARIAEILLEQSIIKAVSHWPGQVILSVWLDSDHEFIQQMLFKYPISLIEQERGDLGAKMFSAFSAFGYPAAIMGCDAPHLASDDLIKAHRLLVQDQPVIGPSSDGGYYLIGLPAEQAPLFCKMQWGIDSVLADTLKRAQRPFQFLGELNDVDLWSDLTAAAREIPILQNYLASEGLELID